MANKIWQELAEAYGRLLALNSDFLKQAAAKNPPDEEAWEAFIEARSTCLECAEISLKTINDKNGGRENYHLNTEEQKLRDQVEQLLQNLQNTEKELAGLLNIELKNTKEVIEQLGQGQAAFKGYGQLKKYQNAHLPKIIDQRS